MVDRSVAAGVEATGLKEGVLLTGGNTSESSAPIPKVSSLTGAEALALESRLEILSKARTIPRA